MSEVAQQVRSHKSYIDKWQPEASSEAELAQIAREQRMLGDDLGQAISEEIK